MESIGDYIGFKGLNSFKQVLGSIIGVVTGDTRSSDYGFYSPTGSQNSNKGTVGPKYESEWYLGPRALILGSLDPQGYLEVRGT